MPRFQYAYWSLREIYLNLDLDEGSKSKTNQINIRFREAIYLLLFIFCLYILCK